MQLDRLTTKSQEAIASAIRQASAEGHPHVEPVHLLLALLGQPEGTAIPLLEAAGASPDRLRTEAETAKIARIRNTKDVEEFWISEPLLPQMLASGRVEQLTDPAPIAFDDQGMLGAF